MQTRANVLIITLRRHSPNGDFVRPTLGTGNTINHNNKTSSNNTDNNSSNAIIITIIIIIIDIMYNISIITVCGLSPSPQRGIKKGDPINKHLRQNLQINGLLCVS